MCMCEKEIFGLQRMARRSLIISAIYMKTIVDSCPSTESRYIHNKYWKELNEISPPISNPLIGLLGFRSFLLHSHYNWPYTAPNITMISCRLIALPIFQLINWQRDFPTLLNISTFKTNVRSITCSSLSPPPSHQRAYIYMEYLPNGWEVMKKKREIAKTAVF